MFVLINLQDVPTLRYLIITLVNVAVLTFADALVDRHLIQAHVNVSVPNLYQSALTIRTSMVLHANVSAHIDHRDVPILKFSTMINASAVAPRYTDALVDSGLIHVHVDVNVLNPDFHVPMLKNLTKLHASVSAPIDQSAAPTLRYLIITLVNVAAQRSMIVPEDKNSTRVHVSVSVPSQDQNAPQLRCSMMEHANVFVQINQGDALIHKFSMMIFAGVAALG